MNQSNNNNQNSNGGGNRPQGGNRPHRNNSNQGGQHGGQKRGFQGRGRPQGQSQSQGQQGNQQGQANQGNQQQSGSGQRPGNQHPNQRRHHHGRNPHNRHRHPNQGQQQGGQHSHHHRDRDVVFEKYEQLRNDHMAARKKYFEMFGTPDNNLKRKLEITFNKTVEALANYEQTLQPVQREALLKKIELYDYDLTYSKNRELIKDDAPVKSAFGLYPSLPGLTDIPPEAPFQDPHYLQTQINRESYKDDTEESVGSIEDYKKLKGL